MTTGWPTSIIRLFVSARKRATCRLQRRRKYGGGGAELPDVSPDAVRGETDACVSFRKACSQSRADLSSRRSYNAVKRGILKCFKAESGPPQKTKWPP